MTDGPTFEAGVERRQWGRCGTYAGLRPPGAVREDLETAKAPRGEEMILAVRCRAALVQPVDPPGDVGAALSRAGMTTRCDALGPGTHRDRPCKMRMADAAGPKRPDAPNEDLTR
jgi:hypothetical protein